MYHFEYAKFFINIFKSAINRFNHTIYKIKHWKIQINFVGN